MSMLPLAKQFYDEMHPDGGPRVGYTLGEIAFSEFYSQFVPKDASLEATLGPVKMRIPLLGAAMDTVSGPKMAIALASMGGAAIIYRHPSPDIQLGWVKKAVRAAPGLVVNPRAVSSEAYIRDAHQINESYGFSTIPVIDQTDHGKRLVGMIFWNKIQYDASEDDPISKWMMPFKDLKRVSSKTSFEKVKARMAMETDCNVLPVVDGRTFHGMYFKKDLKVLNPAYHNGKLLVGMAIGSRPEDLERVQEALRLGVGIIAIDSSHGNCDAVINQAERVVKLVNGQAAVIAGNIASIDGYIRLAKTGVDAVKAGIGSGSICTTSLVTGIGVPMWTLIRDLAYAKQRLEQLDLVAPPFIADGGVAGPGLAVRALMAGASAVMAGEWLASAEEAGDDNLPNLRRMGEEGRARWNRYRGMASPGAINARVADRYGGDKQAPEGVEGWVPHLGPLHRWLPDQLELMRGGFTHVGASDLQTLHERGNEPHTWYVFTGAGQQQTAVRVKTD